MVSYFISSIPETVLEVEALSRYNDLLDDYLKEKDLKRTDIIVKYVCQDNIPLRQETTWVLKVIWNIDLNTLLANIISDGNRSEEIKKIAKNVINCAK